MAGFQLVLLAFLAALIVASAQERVAERLVDAAPNMKRWGGVLLVLIGLYFIATGSFADAFARLFA